MTKEKYYITTPIYYPSSNLHIGHTYCTVMADAMARFKRLAGYDVMFLTGADEHGQKIQKVAEEKGVTPQQHVDEIVGGIKELWARMEISYDDFIRTTEPRHIKRVQEIFKKINDNGDIYKGAYEGWYCTPCESFWTDVQLKDGKCPDCGRPVEKAKEEAYFFRLSKYEDRLLEMMNKGDESFLQPESRRNEMIQFIKQGLDDLCISRSSFDWGIPVPIDDKQVIYVWLDALSNYITALGYPDSPEKYDHYWPADVHLVGKEIVRFHSIIWPAMLMSLELPLPKKVLGHGWLLLEGGKMSKSKGNVVDPVKLIERYGVDTLKYFLLREYTFGQDGLYTNETMLNRINGDLANDLGNLLSRTMGMIAKFSKGHINTIREDEKIDEDLKNMGVSVADKVAEHMDKFAFNHALEEIFVFVRRANKYIDENEPWALGKDDSKKARLNTVLANLCEALRIISILIHPFMHYTAAEIRKQLGIGDDEILWDDAKVFDKYGEFKTHKGVNLFPRIDIKEELEELDKMTNNTQEDKVANEASEAKETQPGKPAIEFDDFDKIEFRVGEIVEAAKHPNADKLLVFQVKIGDEIRQVISGVADSHAPGDCVGRKVIVVANLKPRKLRGEESRGMLLFADNGERSEFVTTDAPDGEIVS